MAAFGVFTQMGVFQFDEVTHMGPGIEHAAWTQARKGSGITALAHHRTIEMAVGFDHDAFTQDAVFDHAIGPNDHIVFDDHATFEDNVDVDEHITSHGYVTSNIEACRVAQGDPQRH